MLRERKNFVAGLSFLKDDLGLGVGIRRYAHALLVWCHMGPFYAWVRYHYKKRTK